MTILKTPFEFSIVSLIRLSATLIAANPSVRSNVCVVTTNSGAAIRFIYKKIQMHIKYSLTFIGISSVEHFCPSISALFTASIPSYAKQLTSMSARILTACGVNFLRMSSKSFCRVSTGISHSSSTLGSLKNKNIILDICNHIRNRLLENVVRGRLLFMLSIEIPCRTLVQVFELSIAVKVQLFGDMSQYTINGFCFRKSILALHQVFRVDTTFRQIDVAYTKQRTYKMMNAVNIV